MTLEQIAEDLHVLNRRQFLVTAAAAGALLFAGSREVLSQEPAQQLEQRVQVSVPLEFRELVKKWEYTNGSITHLVYTPDGIYHLRKKYGASKIELNDLFSKIDLNTGEVIWQRQCDENIGEEVADFLVERDNVIFLPRHHSGPFRENMLKAINSTNGDFLWSPKEGYHIQPGFLTMHDGMLYTIGVIDYKDALFAFSPQDGKELFRRELKSIMPCSPRQMCLYNGNFVLSTGQAFYCIDPKTNTPTWKWVPKGGREDSDSRVRLYYMNQDGNTLYFESRYIIRDALPHMDMFNSFRCRDEIRAFDLDKHKEKWAVEGVGYVIRKFVGDPITYLTNEKNVLDGATGKPTSLPTGKFPLESAVLFEDNNGKLFYVVDKGRVFALNPNGDILREYKSQQSITGTVIGVDQDRVYLRDGNRITAYGKLESQKK